jgi:signal transduction histidine kinase
LNNPSAAVIRGARELVKHLKLVPDKFKDVIKIRVTDEQVDDVNRVIFDHLEEDRPLLSMMQRADMEDEIMDWLDDHGISDQEELTEAFLDYGFSTDQLDQIAGIIPSEYLEPVVQWVAQNLVTEKLVQDIGDASSRINELVSSIKSYTHMDQAPEKKRVDIHDGLRSTVTMLAHKIRKNNVRVEPDWDENIAQPKILVSEMNQVWTNLIDNALDAMEDSEGKELVIKTREEHGHIHVDIQDSGTGIPEEALDHIFDPFFTTKDVGKGTGIGLDIVWQIIAQHNGKISVASEPGKTVFTTVIPID